ncbi:putative transcription factor [Podospora australis]|uniref:Transcription factor n=1 Tax=Podospora australis TaxID=1536484 RepID=A0AAN6WK76_9PEZI|nr:putative transcription factor [Podospora australis]
MRKRACDACHKRKIQCDGVEPSCDWCSHHQLACTFDREIRTRKRAVSKQSSSTSLKASATPVVEETLAHRLQRLEKLLVESINRSQASTGSPQDRSGTPGSALQTPTPASSLPPDNVTSNLTSAASPHASCFGKLHFAGYHLGEISSFNGVPYFSASGREWIRSRTAELPVFPDIFNDDVSPRSLQQRLDFGSWGESNEPALPVRAAAEEYLRFFEASHFRLVFPVVDGALFLDTINAAYGTPVSDTRPVTAKACLFSFLSVVTLFVEEYRRPQIHSLDGDDMAAKAQHLLPPALQEFNLASLQTMIMLTMYQLFSGRIQSSIIFHSLACRILFILGGHTLANPWAPSSEAEVTRRMQKHLRKLFWLTYTLDKELSLRTGQPPCIADEHCDLSLPPGYAETQYMDKYLFADAAQLDETAVPILPGDLRLTLIKSKTCRLLYSAEAMRKSDAELLRDIRELDDELERWRLSVPMKHRPSLSVRRDVAVNSALTDLPDSVRLIVINFEYHYLVATIHRATGRCRAWAKGSSGEMAGISSSLMLSVEASRSTLLYIRNAIPALPVEAFCMMLFYPVSAILTLFCSILLDPLGPQAQDDLELLDSAPHLIRGIRVRQLTENEMLHLKLVDEFVSELSRLANCAIREARRRRDGPTQPALY